MQIRQEQFELMAEARRHASMRRLRTELRQSATFATSHLSDQALFEIMEEATQKARRYGVRSNKSTTLFVKIAVLAGVAFDEDPSIKAFLEMPELDPDYNVTLLAQLACKRINEIAQRE
jgi:hypothetical protein